MVSWFIRTWQREPVLVIDFIKTGLLFAGTFGLSLTPAQQGALFAMLLAFSTLTRSRVSPVPPPARPEEQPEHPEEPAP